MPNYALGETFDLARAYAGAEDVKAAQQMGTLRDLQIKAAQQPKEVSYEDAIGHWRLAKGAAASVLQDPSDENVRSNYETLKRTGSLTSEFNLDAVLAMPPDQRKAGAQRWFNELDTALKNATPPEKDASSIGNVDPSKFTPESLGEFKRTGNYSVLVLRPGSEGDKGYTLGPGSGHYDETGKLQVERPFAPPSVVVTNVGGVPTVVDPGNRTGGGRVQPLSDLSTEAGAGREKKTQETAGGTEAERTGKFIDAGIAAADALTITNRGIQLLNEVPTGGFDAIKLKASNLFGVTGSDEAELSANLGKAVLAQLRSTFGAQFTQQEGERLATIEAGFGKSTEANKRLLEQAAKLLDRAARRGIAAADKAGDTFSADEIRKAMITDIGKTREKMQAAPPAALEYLRAHPEFASAFKAKYGYLP